MSVFISVLVLSGSHLAKEEAEIELITWLASRDQSIIGIGTVGFDLTDLPWSTSLEVYNKQIAFFFRVIDRVKQGEDLKLLTYSPPSVNKYMDSFTAMLKNFDCKYTNQNAAEWWLAPNGKKEKCKIHGAYLHEKGCVVCNDA